MHAGKRKLLALRYKARIKAKRFRMLCVQWAGDGLDKLDQ